MDLSTLSIEELKDLNQQVIAEINYRREQKREENKLFISVGAEVFVNHPKTKGKRFVVTDMRRTKASVRMVGSTMVKYTVPIALLESAK